MSLNKIKVLMIDSWVGEGNEYALYICKELKKAGVNISLIVPEDNIDKEIFDFPFLPLCTTKAKNISKLNKMLRYYKYLLNIYKLIRKEKYDVVHFQFFRRIRVESIYFAMLKLLGVRLAHTVHDVTPLNENKLDHLFNLLVYKTADVLFVHSNSNKRTLTQQIKLNEQKIKVVPHGDFDSLIPDKIPTKSQAREFFGLSQGDNVILFFGAIKEYKGLDMLLNSLYLLVDKIDNLVVIIAGRPDPNKLELEYKNIISKIPNKIKIIFHTQYIPDQEVVKYFIASDAVILPYRRISHSGVLHLAYSFGKPVIATKVGDFEETIEDGKSGFIVSSISPESLSEKTILAFYNKSKLEEMGKYARYLSESKYSWKISAETMRQIYGKMVKDS